MERARSLLPVTVVVVGLAASLGLVRARPSAEAIPPRLEPPTVEVVEVAPRDIQVIVEARGTVVPRTEASLVAEVAGRVVSVAPGLAAGGFFEEGEVLLEVDPADHQLAVERAEAAMQRARSDRELAASVLARSLELAREGIQSPAALDQSRNAERSAEAAMRDARARLAQARRELARTRIDAPFSGRVREKHVDVGEYVTPGRPVARIYAVDFAEVRLPLRDEDAAFLDLPIGYRDVDGARSGRSAHTGPAVRLHARFAGREHEWLGRIVRTEGEIDPRTRMIHAVARVDDPYARGDDPERPPLAVGLFVKARIEGHWLRGVVPVPASALHGADRIVVIDRDSRVRLREVDVLKRQRDALLIRGGLEFGDRVPRSRLEIVAEGMQVRPVAGDALPAARPATVAHSSDTAGRKSPATREATLP